MEFYVVMEDSWFYFSQEINLWHSLIKAILASADFSFVYDH